MTFKEGDCVRARISSGPGPKSYKAGAVYKVTQVYDGRDRIMTIGPNGEANGWLAGNFDLVETGSPLSRAFSTGATRDTDEGKLDFEGFLSPLVMERFAQHMHTARKMPDGSMRNSDNWQLGIPLDVYMKSMWRHFFDVWKSHRGIATTTDIETELCALRFNVDGMLHEILKAKQNGASK
jgi:hypothetical protein